MKRYLIPILVTLFIFACSKEEIPVVKENKGDLISVTFLKTDNQLLPLDLRAIKKGADFFLTIPEDIDLTTLRPKLVISQGATATINSIVYTSSQSFDFTETVKIVVTSESGTKYNYRILVKNGRNNIDNLIYDFMEKFSIPGVSVAISLNEKIIYNSGFGYAIDEADIRTTPEHLYRLASISKQFTSLCIMKLYEEKRLKITDRVFGTGGILQENYADTYISPMAATVTIQHLLEHTSGWVTDPDPMFTSSFRGQTLDQLIKYVLASKQSEPGKKYDYFNMGYGILGKVIEKLSGKSYEEYLKSVLLEADIDDIHVGKDRAGRRANEVVYYSQNNTNGYLNDMSVIAAAGGVIASSGQMLNLLFRIDGLPNKTDIILASTREMMLKPSTAYNRYALGWRLGHSYYPNAYYHSGNLAGTAVMWVMGPEANCVVLCNSRSYITGFDDELFGLLRDLYAIARD